MTQLKNVFTAWAAGALLLACEGTPETLDASHELAYCHTQVCRSLDELRQAEGGQMDYNMMPRNVLKGEKQWNCRRADNPEEWCNGFWPGILWYDYEATGDETIRQEAERFTQQLEYLSRRPAFDHDLGFLIYCSYGNGFRLTGREDYRQVILATADTLATLYRPQVGTILSWPRNVGAFGGHNTIMDNMINLEMLMWASRNGGSRQLAEIAINHADKTMKYHFRPDFTSYHVAVYDTLTGDFLRGCTHQGLADHTMWARGQAWAIYGFTTMYRFTRSESYLEFVQQVADVYLQRLPDDGVPYWDFDDPQIPTAPRDASAAAVVASALLELADYVPAVKANYYVEAARKMLSSLSSKAYQSRRANPSFLLHSTGHLPAGSEIDASIIYADYYYIEALLRLQRVERGEPLYPEYDEVK